MAALLWALLVSVGQLHAHDEHGGHSAQSEFAHFVRENALTIQIGAGVVLVASIAVFVMTRRARGRKQNDAAAPAPGKPQDPKLSP